MSNTRLITGDAVKQMQEIDSSSIDLIIADPPYNLGKNYGNNYDAKKFDEYLSFTNSWLQQAHRLLKYNGTVYVFMGFRFISYLFNILERDLKMYFRNWIVWHYTQGIGKTKGFSPRHDDILMFTKSDEFKFNLDAVRVPQKYYRERNNMRGANPGDVWEFSHVHYCNGNRQNHPTQKPEGLIERMVLASSCKGDRVLDPFSGSGTTLRVCQQLKRDCIGIEINSDYVKMTQKRLSEPFKGFDSVDPRMERVPLDLRRPDIRDEYLENHKKWFLSNHENAMKKFVQSVESVYGDQSSKQLSLFE
ncbi:DNA adenine methyltransferase YhdJ [Sedimentisphaera cyanobacteriorum]|uniref:Methyltransferase n=1 Tax=Sedimentisphaera cyanobacteriorum TaxID=1940790 RepID=A0A1Q2HS65_9BACT|nr:site-specific DNA-methyltransferase [Sedimentisphaera cyanobacteriorum]AQQ10114.1 DNA adenine methyltransferase YhdJ [Sedimentisphaera cyanobacteriorum]